MADRLTDDDIARGLALAEAATPVPWHTRCISVATHADIEGDAVCSPPRVELTESYKRWPANKAYIVDACNHYPAALRELAELRAECERLRSEVSRWRATASQAQQEVLMIRSRGE
jgi:hypothetical protein